MATKADTTEKKATAKAWTPKTVAGVKIEIREGEEAFVHALIEKGPLYSPTTGERLSKPYVHITEPKNWNLTKDSFVRLGITVHDVYEPA